MDHWWYLFSQKPERKISAFLEAKIRAYLIPGPYIETGTETGIETVVKTLQTIETVD